MAKYSRSSFHKILILVFGIAFGLVALMMAYQGVKTNLDSRSRAAQDAVEYKRWDFISDAEGWTGTKVGALSVSGGVLSAIVNAGSVFNSPTGTISLPKGNKYIKIRVSAVNTIPVLGDQAEVRGGSPGFVSGNAPVGEDTVPSEMTPMPFVSTGPCVPKPTCVPGRPCAQLQIYPLGGWCEDATPFPTNSPEKRYITMSIHHGNESSGRLLTVRVPVDGTMNDYTVQFPQIDEMSFNQLSIQVDSGAVKLDKVSFDSISLVGPVVTGGVTACTLEAKICPDGSSVGRTGPNCEFAPCGSGNTSPIPLPAVSPREGRDRGTPVFVPGNPGIGDEPVAPNLTPQPTVSKVPCVPRPTCVPGQQCAQLQYYPIGGWCPTEPPSTPTPPPTVDWFSSFGDFIRGLFGLH